MERVPLIGRPTPAESAQDKSDTGKNSKAQVSFKKGKSSSNNNTSHSDDEDEEEEASESKTPTQLGGGSSTRRGSQISKRSENYK